MNLPLDKLRPLLTTEQFEAAQRIAHSEENGIAWWRVGEGKTRIALAWMFMVAEHPRPLIICSPGAFRQWRDEIKLVGLRGIIKPRFMSVGLLSRRNKLIIDFESLNCIVADELWMYKNPKSKRSKMLSQMTHRMPSLGLSGSLMTAGNIEDVYGQARALNLDKKLSSSLTGFRQEFEIPLTNYAGFLERFPKKGALQSIQQKLVNNIDVYFPKESRIIRDIKINVDPTSEQLELKHELVKNWLLENRGEVLQIKNAMSLVVKLQQISDGFVKVSEKNYLGVNSSKLHRLKEICAELLDAGERAIIWTGFVYSAQMLSGVLPGKSTLLTSHDHFNVSGWRSGKIPLTIATIGSGASLNDFANVKYSLFYSTNFSSLGYEQARGRTNRKSSISKSSYYYRFATDKFPDSSIHKKIDENKNQETILIEIATKICEEYKRDL
jgi:hypothetical protein